jgi:hypothetical protein
VPPSRPIFDSDEQLHKVHVAVSGKR